MKLIVIFGPPAVGKMAVGKELEKLTDFKLFHNHMLIEPIYNFFTFADKQLLELTSEFRKRLFEEFGKSSLPAIIFTYVWALDDEDDHAELLEYLHCMKLGIEDVLFVELEADQSVRLDRNKSELRLKEKRSKQNIEESENFLKWAEENSSLNTKDDFFYPDQHIKINNTSISAKDAAEIIKQEIEKRKIVV
ncbi:DEAD/DEAH box helicase family protein [Spirochaeta dissipatitropha]